jgi:hypothetical protein
MELKRQIASARGQITKLCLSLTVDPNDKSIAVRLEAGSEKLSALLAQRDERLIRLYGNDEYDDEGELINVSSTAANNA